MGLGYLCAPFLTNSMNPKKRDDKEILTLKRCKVTKAYKLSAEELLLAHIEGYRLFRSRSRHTHERRTTDHATASGSRTTDIEDEQ